MFQGLSLHRGSRRPRPGAQLNLQHPFVRGHLFSFYMLDAPLTPTPLTTRFEMFYGKLTSALNWRMNTGVTYGSNADGGCITFNAGATSSSVQMFGAAALLPTTACTIALIRRKRDATARNSAIFGGSTTAAQRIGAHLPFSDGNVYWDFGGTSSPNRLSVSGLSFAGIEKWVFTAGPRGSAIYRNGIKLTSQSTAITRTAGTSDFFLNLGNGAAAGDNQDLNAFIMLDEQWSDALAQWWCAEPYAHFRSELIAYALISAEAGSGGGGGPTHTFPALTVAL